MSDPIVEELALELAPALASISSIDDALGTVVTNFSTGISDALGTITSGITIENVDAAPVTDSVSTALADALDGPRSVDVEVDADTAPAQAAIAAVAAQPIEIPVDADTTAAQQSIDDLNASATSAGGGLDSLDGGVEALKASTGLATGELEGFGGIVANIGPQSAAAVSGAAAFTAFLGASINLAADAEAQNKRFGDTFGVLAQRVRAVDVGGLSIDLDQLAAKSGTANADLEASASRVGQLGQSAGASSDKIVSTTQTVLALGAAASVTNPRLGDAADVSDKLSTAFVRGGKALVPYGINLSKAAIEQEALRQTGKASADQLSTFDRIAAGASLAAGQFGDTLGTRFASGADNAQVKLRAVKQQFEEALVSIGKPIVVPALDVLEGFVPVAKEIGTDLGDLARIVLPFVSALEPVLVPVGVALRVVGDGLDVIANAVGALPPAALIAIAVGLTSIAVASVGMTAALATVSDVIGAIAPEIALPLLAIGLLGTAFDLFGNKSESLQAHAKDAGDAMFVAAGDAGLFREGLTSANAAFLHFLEGEDAKGKLKDLDEALDRSHNTLVSASSAITGTNDDYESLKRSLFDTSAFTKQQTSLLGLGHDLRGTDIIANHLTQTQADQVNAANRATRAVDDQRDTFDSAADTQLKFLFNSGQITRAQFDAAEAIAHATKGVRGFGAALDNGNQSLDRNADSQAAANVRTAQAAGVFDDLRAKLLAGTISAADAQNQLVTQFNLLPDAAKAFTDGVTQAVQSLVDSIVNQLPTASAAVDEFSGDVKTAFSDVLQQLGDNSGVTSATGALKTANQRLHDVESKAVGTTKSDGVAHAQAIQDAKTAVSRAEQDVVDAKAADAKKLAEAQEKLRQAADPNKFISELFSDAQNSGKFLKALETLSGENLNAVALVLAQKGPEAAGALAQKLADNPAQAKFAEAGVVAGTKVQQEFTKFIKEKLGPAVLGPSEQVGNTLGSGVNLGFSEGFDVGAAVKPTGKQLDAARVAGSQIGASYSEGLKFGLVNGIPLVQNASATLHDGIVAVGRDRTQTQSPSKVAIELGHDYVEGLAIGLTPTAHLDGRVKSLVDQLTVPLALFGSQVAPRVAAGRTVANTPVVPRVPVGAGAPVEHVIRKDVHSVVELHKVDVDPRHLANEIAWQVAT